MTRDGYIMEKNSRTPLISGSKLFIGNTEYTIDELIGEGGTSLVYRGKDSSGVFVIIKELYPLLGKKIERSSQNSLQIPTEIEEYFYKLCQREKEVYELSKRLLNEGRRTNDPHSWVYVKAFEANNTYYQISQDVSGKSLDKAITSEMILLKELSDYVEIGLHMIPAIRSLHEKKLIHADLKPQNIFVVDSKPNVFYRCLDFGSAVHEGEPCIISTTPEYAPPEIEFGSNGTIKNDNTGKKGVQYDYDTYSILAIIYELLTGTSPKNREDKNAEMFTRGASELFNISEEALRYMNIIFKNGLSTNRDLRFKTLDSLEKALEKLKVMLEKKIYIESVSLRNISPSLRMIDQYEEVFNLAIKEDKSISFFKTEKKRDAFFSCAQFFSYCRGKRANYKIIPVTYRNDSLKDTLCALPFGFSGIMPYDEKKILELKNLGAEYCVVVLGYQYSEKDKEILESLEDNKGVRFWFFGDSRFDGKYYSLPSDDKYAISTTGKGMLKYFGVAANYGLSKQILEKLDDVDWNEVEGLCQNGTLWRFGNKIYCSPEVFSFVNTEDEEDLDRRSIVLKLLESIISCSEDEGYKPLNQYQSLTVSDFQLSMFLLKQLPCEKQMSELLSKVFNCCDKNNFREYLLNGYKEIFENFLPSDVEKEQYNSNSKNAYILGANYVEFCGLIERGGDREEKIREYIFILYEISKYPDQLLKSRMETKDYDKVIEAATMLIDLFSYCGDSYKNSVDLYYEMRGKAYYEKGDYEKAEADYTELIENREKRTFEIYTNRARTYVKMMNDKCAEDDYTSAIEVNSNNADAWNNRGIFYSDVLGYYTKAKLDYEKAIDLNDKNPVFYSNLCGAEIRLQNWVKGEAAIEKALNLDMDNAFFWNKKGMLYAAMGNHGVAEVCFVKAIMLDKGVTEYYFNLAATEICLRRWLVVAEVIKKIKSIEKREGRVCAIEGLFYYTVGQTDVAEECYKKAAEFDKFDPAMWMTLGSVQRLQGKWKEAEESIEKGIALQRKTKNLWDERGLLWYQREDKSIKTRLLEAEESFSHSLLIENKDERIWGFLGNVRRDMHKFLGAKDAFEQAIKINPQYSEGWNGLGNTLFDLYYEIDNKDVLKIALKYLEIALQLEPANENYKEDVLVVKEELE